MSISARFYLAASLTLLVLCLSGCTGEKTPTANPPAQSGHDGHDHAAHAHPTEGPHHGDLIELGKEEYHAELLHDDESVTIYVLDSTATNQVAITGEAVTINSTMNGTPQQFSLSAQPDEGDPDGQSSRFVSNDATLAQTIDSHDVTHRVAISIDGKSYRGEITHDHDHDDHGEHGHDQDADGAH